MTQKLASVQTAQSDAAIAQAQNVGKAIDLVAGVIAAGLRIETERRAFEHELNLLRKSDESFELRTERLMKLVETASLSDSSKAQLVDTICQLALR